MEALRPRRLDEIDQAVQNANLAFELDRVGECFVADLNHLRYKDSVIARGDSGKGVTGLLTYNPLNSSAKIVISTRSERVSKSPPLLHILEGDT